MPKNKNIVKLTVNLPTATVEDLRAYAMHEGITMTEAIRQALGLQVFIAKEEARGTKILLKRKSGEWRQLIFAREEREKNGLS